jgi:hypothetical protein
LTQLLVEKQQSAAVPFDPLEFPDEQREVGLLFHLLGDEPVEHDLGGVIFLGTGEFHEIADACGDELFVVQSKLDGFERRFKVVFWPVDGPQLGASGNAADEVEELFAMGHLLESLHPHPAGESGQVFGLEVTGHGHVQVGREKFVFHLFVERVLKLLAEHSFPPCESCRHAGFACRQ